MGNYNLRPVQCRYIFARLGSVLFSCCHSFLLILLFLNAVVWSGGSFI